MKSLKINTSGRGDSLLVLHGWGMNSTVWQPVKRQLEQNFTVSFIDLPGHGENKTVTATSLEQIVEVILSRFFKPSTQVHLLGWSLGGIVAQAIALQIPEQIKSLTMVASTPRFSQWLNSKEPNKNWQHAMPKTVLEQFSGNLNKDIEGTIKRFIALQFMGSKTSAETSTKQMQRALTASVLNELPTSDALKTGLDILMHTDLRQLQLQVQVQSLQRHWILGQRDRLVPIKVSEDLKRIYPDDQITIFNDAGHAPFMTHPQQFVQTLVDFINAR